MDTALAPAPAPTAARIALLDAALHAFAARGFEGAGTRAIAQTVGVNQGLIRHHFGSKEGLWRELIERGLEHLEQALQSTPLTAVLADQPSDGLNPRLALLHVIVHGLLESGPRRDWLVRVQLEPLRRRWLARLPAADPTQAALPPNDALLLSWLGATLAPALFAPALRAVTGRAVAIELAAAPDARAPLGSWARPSSPPRVAGPWSPARTSGSTPAAAS